MQSQLHIGTTAIYESCPINHQIQEIRLIELLPGQRRQKGVDPLVCRLVSTGLRSTDQLQYTALSYVWGETTYKQAISLNGKLFGVTPNLHAALVYLRDENLPVWLWVDAVCINQSDVDERNCQVAQMSDIYLHARRVIAWLGEAADESDAAMEYLSSFSSTNTCSTQVSPALQMALDALWRRPYWTRVWILQELFFGKERAFFQCGYQSCPLEAIGCYIKERKLSDVVNSKHTFWKPRKLVILAMGDKSDAVTVLHRSCHLQSTLTIDKVYGLLGIFSDEFRELCQPDYSKDLQQVITEVFEACLSTYKTLDILCDFARLPPRDGTPTFLPDITNALHGLRTIYSSCGTKRTSRAVLRGNTLEVYGAVISRVDDIRGPVETRADVLLDNYQQRQGLATFEVLREIRRVSLRFLRHKLDPESSFIDLTAGTRRWHQNSRICPFSCEELWDVVGKQETLSPDQFAHRAPFFEFMFEQLRNRRFFTTENGLIGLGPPDTEKGDLVCIFNGCTLPIILRKAPLEGSNDMHHIGPSYVDGAMSGEFAGLLSNGTGNSADGDTIFRIV